MEDGDAAGHDHPTADDAQQVFDAFLRIMDQAAKEPHIGPRLALADTVVHIHFADSPQDLVLTLFLDRTPVEAVVGAQGHPEITLEARTADVLRFWTGNYHLAMGIARGEVTYTGPVRKLLRVVPIARRLVDPFKQMIDQTPEEAPR